MTDQQPRFAFGLDGGLFDLRDRSVQGDLIGRGDCDQSGEAQVGVPDGESLFAGEQILVLGGAGVALELVTLRDMCGLTVGTGFWVQGSA